MFIRLSLYRIKLQINAIGLSKQQKLDTDTKLMQQINFTGSLDKAESSTMFFITEEVK